MVGTALAIGLGDADGNGQSEQPKSANEIDQPVQVANDVFFHQGDIDREGHCNNGWIVFKDYVLCNRWQFSLGSAEHPAEDPRHHS